MRHDEKPEEENLFGALVGVFVDVFTLGYGI